MASAISPKVSSTRWSASDQGIAGNRSVGIAVCGRKSDGINSCNCSRSRRVRFQYIQNVPDNVVSIASRARACCRLGRLRFADRLLLTADATCHRGHRTSPHRHGCGRHDRGYQLQRGMQPDRRTAHMPDAISASTRASSAAIAASASASFWSTSA